MARRLLWLGAVVLLTHASVGCHPHHGHFCRFGGHCHRPFLRCVTPCIDTCCDPCCDPCGSCCFKPARLGAPVGVSGPGMIITPDAPMMMPGHHAPPVIDESLSLAQPVLLGAPTPGQFP